MTRNLLKFYFFLANVNEKKIFYFFIIFSIVGTFVETFSIATFYPLLKFVGEGSTSLPLLITNFISKFSVSNLFIENLDTQYLLIEGSLIIIIFVYILRTFLLIFLNYLQYLFIFELKKNISQRLYKKYLKISFLDYMNLSSSNIIRNLTSSLDSLVTGLNAIAQIIVDFFLLLMITIFLLFFNYKVTLVFFILILFLTTVFYVVFRNIFYTWGAIRQEYDQKNLKHIQETFSGFQETKNLGLENILTDKFKLILYKLQKVQMKFGFYQSMPRILIEMFLVIIISFFLLFYLILNEQNNLYDVLPTLAVYVVAATKLLPAFNKLLSNFNALKFATPSMILIKNEYNNKYKIIKKKINIKSFKKSIELKNISFNYSGKSILENLNFKIIKGETIGIFGESGSGKTTLLNIIMGLLQPTKGNIYVDKKKINLELVNWNEHIACINQNNFLFEDTIKNNIVFFENENNIDYSRLEKILIKLNLTNLIKSLKHGINTTIGERGSKLSGGEKQRISIARALYNKRKILIMDEPTSALDKETEKKIIEIIKNLKGEITIIIVSHDLNVLNFSDKLFELKEKKLIKKNNYRHFV